MNELTHADRMHDLKGDLLRYDRQSWGVSLRRALAAEEQCREMVLLLHRLVAAKNGQAEESLHIIANDAEELLWRLH